MTTPADASRPLPEASRPLPQPTEVSRPHWDGARRGELLFQRCGACARPVFPPTLLCPYCSSPALIWEASSGLGTVYSHTVVWRPQLPVFEVPYVVAVVELEEHWHMFSTIVFPADAGGSPADVHIGLPVRVRYVAVEGSVLPCFEIRGFEARA